MEKRQRVVEELQCCRVQILLLVCWGWSQPHTIVVETKFWVASLFVEIGFTDFYSLSVNQTQSFHGSWMYRSALTWIGISNIQLTFVTGFNWVVVYTICNTLGLGSSACRAKLRQGVFQLVFLDALRQIIGQLNSGYFGLNDSSLSLFFEFKNFQQVLVLETLLLKLKLLLFFEMSEVGFDEDVLFLSESAGVLAETFGVLSLVFA